MLLVLILTITQIGYSETIKTTPSVSIIFNGFTLQSWNDQLVWNKTQQSIIHHLNKFCKDNIHCPVYENKNIHLLNVTPNSSSSVCLNISIDKPTINLSSYNYTALLNQVLHQTKVDIEKFYGNHSLTTSIYSSKNPEINRINRFLLVFLGIALVTIVFAVTLFCIQKIRQYGYSSFFKSRQTSQSPTD